MDVQPYAALDPVTVGSRLQEARKARRLTQQDAADALGVARTTIVAMEKGERRLQPAELVRLAELYGRQVHDLVRQRPTQHSFSTVFRVVYTTARLSVQERLADGFARFFLLPSSGLSRRFNMLRRADDNTITPADLLTLADYFRVSFETLLRLLEELRLLPLGTWGRLQDAGFKVREAQSLLALGGSEVTADTELLPTRYKYLAVEAFDRGELTEGQFAQYLRTDRLRARALARQLAERPDVDAGGGAGILPIDFSQPISATPA
jgi:transcriptional regulator with XRE-family HTH domain